ncbi:hypothetical protein [Parenemella sanctibonifatiensis]|uniref:Uncharacterized protein n=1 Tax=Parenemella sanctibonifatiensis TaxID=2016505 RepID=A0A255EMB4_9ACTN|nr:hypothetical protein [Parenemella sanctibonifatiensis]OYN92350.1 hypothetical protein CGZ91_02275 [Parenemella sanctibonifatiensis]
MSDPFDFSGYGQGSGSRQGGQPSSGQGQPFGGGTDPFADAQQPPQQGGFGSPQGGGFGGGPQGQQGPQPSFANDPFAGNNGNDPFGGPAVSGGGAAAMMSTSRPALVAAAPPFWMLLIALGLGLAAGVVALIFGHIAVAFICWALAGPVAIGMIGLYVRGDSKARASGLYASPGFVQPLYWVTVVVCLLCILAPAWRIAEWAGRL